MNKCLGFKGFVGVGVLKYARSYLAKMSQIGYCREVKGLIAIHGGTKLSDVPVENYAGFIDEVLEFYKEKAEETEG